MITQWCSSANSPAGRRADTCDFISDDGTPIFVCRWRPDSPARAIVHIAHGLAEHAARYAPVAEALTSRGYLVYAHDHRGHGHTARSPEALGHFADRNGWQRIVQDLRLLIVEEKEANPGLPAVLLGHSMGSFLSQHFLCEHGDLLDGCALSGSNGDPIRLVLVLEALARMQRFLFGRHARGRLLNSLSLKQANRAFQPTRTDFDWLSRNAEVVDRYVADPLCGWIGTLQLWIDLIYGAKVIARPEKRAHIRKDTPIYIFAGTADPISRGCAGLEQLISAYRKAGLRRVEHRFYPGGRHEMLNEINREEVIADLIGWLDRITSA